MNTYFVIWTYVANFGTMVVNADSPEAAIERVRLGFSDDFRKRGTLYAMIPQNVTCRVGEAIAQQVM